VVDHDSGRLVWAAPGRDKATLKSFFDAVEASGEGRCSQISHVSADGADWISAVVEKHCPTAVRCADPFHIVKWATEALDEVRRQAWNTARGAVTQRRAGRAGGHAKALKGARYALWKNPENLTTRQQAKLAWIAKTDPRLHRAYLLKEGLRTIFSLDPADATVALDKWIGWARRCRIETFVKLQRRILKHKASILAAIEHGLSNGRIEPSTPKSDSSPALRSASPHPTHSSPSPCSPSAATHPHYPTGNDPRISQQSPKNGPIVRHGIPDHHRSRSAPSFVTQPTLPTPAQPRTTLRARKSPTRRRRMRRRTSYQRHEHLADTGTAESGGST